MPDAAQPEDAMDIAGVEDFVGAVRRGPQGHGVVRISNVGEDDWLMLGAGSDPLHHRYTDGRVWNWPVVGVVPGTPASWRAGEPLFEQEYGRPTMPDRTVRRMKATNRFIARLAPCLVVIAAAFFTLGVIRHNGPATTAALVSVLTGIFAWIGAS